VQELLVATTNAGKLREIIGMLEGLPIHLQTLADFPNIPPVEETGATFAENARQKAVYYGGLTRMFTVAEDSGFEVDALNREPGIYSARYLREDASYDERFADLYRRARETGAHPLQARFVCALAVAEGLNVVFETTAVVEGLVADVARGAHGFGYDPIFFYPPYGKTFGEVSEAEKTAVSHRGQAMRALRAYLAGGLHLATSWPVQPPRHPV
jgi:non-canonical purine NTP pyrophosphatase (RdgB/HAM1 family)